MPGDSDSGRLLSLQDLVLLYLYKVGAYEGSKADLARLFDDRDKGNIHRVPDALVAKGLVRCSDSGSGYEMTSKGKRRMWLFGIPRLLFCLVAALSVYSVTAGAAALFFGTPVSAAPLMATGLVSVDRSAQYAFVVLP